MNNNDLARILFNKSFDELDDSQKKTVLNFEETIDKTLNWYYNVLIKKEDSYENCIRDIIFYIKKIKIWI